MFYRRYETFTYEPISHKFRRRCFFKVLFLFFIFRRIKTSFERKKKVALTCTPNIDERPEHIRPFQTLGSTLLLLGARYDNASGKDLIRLDVKPITL